MLKPGNKKGLRVLYFRSDLSIYHFNVSILEQLKTLHPKTYGCVSLNTVRHSSSTLLCIAVTTVVILNLEENYRLKMIITNTIVEVEGLISTLLLDAEVS